MILYLSSNKLGNKTNFLKDWIENNSKKIVLITNARDAKIQNNEEKEKLNKNVQYMQEKRIKYKALSDGDVIIQA